MRSIKEAWGTKSDRPTSKTFVMYASMIHVEGFTSLKAKSDGTMAIITSQDGEVTIDDPGDYFLKKGGESGQLELRRMTPEETSKYMAKLSPSEKRKLEKERKMVKETGTTGAEAADDVPPPDVPQ